MQLTVGSVTPMSAVSATATGSLSNNGGSSSGPCGRQRIVDHTYRNYSKYFELGGAVGEKKRSTFPTKLHEMVSDRENEGVIEWMVRIIGSCRCECYLPDLPPPPACVRARNNAIGGLALSTSRTVGRGRSWTGIA